MGHITHEAIVVTSWKEELLQSAKTEALRVGLPVSSIVHHPVNGGGSFLISSCGSKYGWAESMEHTENLWHFKEWAKKQRHSDGSSSLSWVEIHYGSDDADALVADHEWKDGQEGEPEDAEGHAEKSAETLRRYGRAGV